MASCIFISGIGIFTLRISANQQFLLRFPKNGNVHIYQFLYLAIDSTVCVNLWITVVKTPFTFFQKQVKMHLWNPIKLASNDV